MNHHIYGSKVPQQLHFGGLNRHFKPNMRKIQIDQKFFRSVYQQPATETSWVVSYGGKTIPRWRTQIRVVLSPYLSEKSSAFDEILYTAADVELDERHVINNEKMHWTDSQLDRTYFLFSINLPKKDIPLNDLYKIWVGGGSPRSASSCQISPLWR